MGIPPANERQPNPPNGWRGIYLVFAVSSSLKLKSGFSPFYRPQSLGRELKPGVFLSCRSRGTGSEIILAQQQGIAVEYRETNILMHPDCFWSAGIPYSYIAQGSAHQMVLPITGQVFPHQLTTRAVYHRCGNMLT